MAQPKNECRVEKWWLSTVMTEEGALILCGSYFGHPDYKDGEFQAVEVFHVHIPNQMAESTDCYIKLGEPQNLRKALADMSTRSLAQAVKEKMKP